MTIILIPVFNDWESLVVLERDLDRCLYAAGREAHLLIVDDGSTEPDSNQLALRGLHALTKVSILRLRRNLGHQRAIAIGLAWIRSNTSCHDVVIMDGDGEDSPADVPRLLAKAEDENHQTVVFAERRRRSESWVFQLFYHLYRAVHWLLVGIPVRVGNFSVVPRSSLERLVAMSELWSHYAATVLKTGMPHTFVPTARAHRISGTSKMNFIALVTHGLTAISVYSETVGVRALVALVLSVFVLSGGFAVTFVSLHGDLSKAELVLGGAFLIAVLELAIVATIVVLFMLSGRQNFGFVPLRDYEHFILSVEHVVIDGPGSPPPQDIEDAFG